MEVTFKDVYTYKSKFNFSPLFLMEKITPLLKTKDYIKLVAYQLEQKRLKITIFGKEDRTESITREQYQELIDEILKLKGFDMNEVEPVMSGWGALSIFIDLERG